ncbi:pectate lyase family protein [Cellvibrio sp. OA-2007]|uniref:pectate lyase family protein n=1 Tax=Cellvibrio sp. OA-2007 TaxID=529823 RepID=UPI0009FE644C|nr:CBM35 domain-containing protein [Cellvibrio sp. OA-2007]
MTSMKLSCRIGQYMAFTAATSVLACAVQAQTLGSNLALTGPSAGADGSGFSDTKLVRDADTATYTEASGTSNQRVSVKWGSEVAFNTVVLRESGSKVTSWQLVNNDTGDVLATGTGIGAARTVNLGSVSMKKLNLIVSGSSPLRMAEIEVYNATGASSVAPSSAPASSKPASSIAPIVQTQVYQAESGSLSQAAVESNHAGYNGSGFVNFDNLVGSAIQWTVNQASAGNATLSFRFANGSTTNRPMSISVNGTVVNSALAFNGTGAWATWATQTMTAYLNAGNNVIRAVSTASDGGPNLDELSVTSTLVVASSSAPASSVAPSSKPASSVAPSSTPASSTPASSLATSSAPSSYNGAIRPAKMEGFAAYANVTGGTGGSVVTVSTGTQLNAALCGRSTMSEPIVIRVNGTINHGNTTSQGCNTQSDVIEIKQMSNVSIIGVGTNALFDEIGIHVRDASNIIIQNVHIRNVKKSGSPTSNGGDAIGMETNVDRVWIDHNWLEASGGEKDGYDSLLDMKAGVTNVTVSYNLYNDSSRAGLIGSSDSDNKNTNITFHHNWYKNIEQRTPLIRHALVHMYNNYWSNDSIDYMFHGINSRMNAKALVESNYFYNANNPLIASDDSSTPGCWQTNNDNTVLPEIYYSRTVGDGALVVPAVVNGQLQSTCSVSVPYSVQMDAANDVPAIVMANVGVGKIGAVSNSSAPASSKPASSVLASSKSSTAPGSVPASSTPASQTQVYQAESASLSQAAVESNHTGFNGSGFVNFDNLVGSSAQWTVNQASAGNVTLTFRFANGTTTNRPMSISVNGTVVNSGLAFNGTGAWASWAEQSFTAYLNAGSNVIRAVSTSGDGGPNIDQLSVTGGAVVVGSSSSQASVAPSSSSVASSQSSSSSSVIVDNGTISAACIQLATNPSVNWRDTSLKTDQEIVSCLSKTLGKPVGYGEKALGGFDPNGNSKLTIITKTGGVSVEQQLLNALTDNAHNWIVFDKIQFAQPSEIGMYRTYCNNSTVQSLMGITEAQCNDYRSWCSSKGISGEAACRTEFFNKAMNHKDIPIRIPAIGSNKTLDGRGSEAYFLFSGFAIGKDSSGAPTQTSESVILTHLKFQGAGHTEDHYVDPDMIRSTGASHDIWIHKNTFDTTGDSAFDVKVGAYDITMSFNRLVNVKRAVLHGSSDSRTINSQITTTMHNNAFVTTDDSYMLLGNTLRRVPLLRRGTTHMFNNVFVNYRNQILSLRVGASALMEDSVFVVNAVHQEKSSVEASLAEISSNLFKDISDGNFRNDRNLLWFGSATCNLTSSTQTALTASNGSVANLANNYSAASRATINSWRFAAGQELVDYVSATAGKHGQIPYNSPLAGDKYYVLGLGKVPCQTR